MESDRLDPREARRIAERAEAAPYVDYPPTPWWYAPVVGLWSAALLLNLSLAGSHTAIAVPAILILVTLEGAAIGWYFRRYGAVPSMRRPPAEFRRALAGYAVGCLAVVALVALAWHTTGPPVAALLAGVLVTIGLLVYERSYAAAARRTRDRLA